MENLINNRHWFLPVIFGFWLYMGQSIFIVENLNKIDGRFGLALSLILIAIFIISFGISRLLALEGLRNIFIISALLSLILAVNLIISVIFNTLVGLNYLLIQVIIIISLWHRHQRLKIEN